MPDFLRPVARYWYDLPDLGDVPAGPALSDALLAEERTHGATRDVVWAYAEAMPALLGPDPMIDVQPLAFSRGALRAAVLNRPADLAGLYHVQTESPEVCRVMGARVPSFSVRGEACVRALIEHGSAVRNVVAHGCAAFDANAGFQLTFARPSDREASRWFKSYPAEHFMPIARLDLDEWLCWDRDFARACVVRGYDQVVEGRWGPRDVIPEAEPPPWGERDAESMGGERWAGSMVHDHRRGGSSILADRARGWCLLHVGGESAYHEALRSAWKEGHGLQGVESSPGGFGTLAELRLEGPTAHFAWLGHQRVLRVRGGELEQLTTDHDLRALALSGGIPIEPDLLAEMDSFRNVTTRGLPKDAPEQGTCGVEPGDRFVLIDAFTQEILERVAGGRDAFAARLRQGTPRVVARWMRYAFEHTDDERPVAVIDGDATIEVREPRPGIAAPVEPTSRDLMDRPAEFHGRRVRFRAVYHRRKNPDVSMIADAWFEGECALPEGTWVVDADGLWLHDGTPRGPAGAYPSELRGTLAPADLSRARPIAPDRIRFARRYVPLSAEIVVERGLFAWTYDRQAVARLGPSAGLPCVETPERTRVRATFCVSAYGNLVLIDWEIVASEPLPPTPATPASPGPRGRYVEVHGLLVPTEGFPRLEDVLEVSPPSHTRSDHRLDPPSLEEVARYRAALGKGRLVTVRGEVGSKGKLLGLSMTGYDGKPFDL